MLKKLSFIINFSFLFTFILIYSQDNSKIIDELFSSEFDPEVKMVSKKNVEFFIEPKVATNIYVKGQIMAGMAMNDITPPPGLTTAGHSSFATITTGFRTRLKCRAIYLKGKNGVPTIVIQVDLIAPSRVLHHSVASALSEMTDVPYGNISLAATHTHTSNGNYSDVMIFNQRFGKVPGFDLELFDFMKDQMIDAGLKAYQNRKPAKIASGKKEIYYVNRNRAITSYIKNKGNENMDISDSTLIFTEVNPYLKMVRIDVLQENGQYKPIGAYSIFSVHGTSVANSSDLNSGDIFSYAQRDVAWKIDKKYNLKNNSIFAFSTGSEGDMTPNMPFYNGSQYEKETKHIPLDWGASEKLGLKLADTAWELFEELGTELTEDIEVFSANREIDILEENEISGIEICKRPSIGMSAMNGAYENRAIDFFLVNDESFFTRKIIYSKNRCHGNKVIPLGKISRLIQPVKNFPRQAMFQYLQIGDIGIVFLPWEVSITTEKRIFKKINTVLRESNEKELIGFSIVGASNDYFGYAVTPEEYSNQSYQAGMTYYGKNIEPYITAQLGKLVKDLAESGKDTFFDLPKNYKIETTVKDLYPRSATKKIHTKRHVITNPILIIEDLKNVIDEPYIKFQWEDVAIENMKFHEAILVVEVSKDKKNWETLVIGNHIIDDEGYHIAVKSIVDNKSTKNIYEGRWFNPKMDENSFYRFKVLPRNDSQKELLVPIGNNLLD